MMYDSGNHYFDPLSIGIQNETPTVAATTSAMDFQHEHQNLNNAHLMQEVIVIHDEEPSPVQRGPLGSGVHYDNNLYQEMQEQNTNHYHQQEQYYQQQIRLQHLSSGGDVLASPSTVLPNFSLDMFGESGYNNEANHGGDNAAGSSSNLYEQTMPLDLNNLFEPQNYGVTNSLFGGEMDDEPKGDYQQQNEAADNNDGIRNFEYLVSEFKRDANIHGVGGSTGRSTNGLGIAGHGHGYKHRSIEKMKREKLGDQFKALSLLVPTPSKTDRASTLASTIAYINELKGTVEYLKILVDKKRNERKRKFNIENDGDMASSSMIPTSSMNMDRDQNNGQVRSSWSQRKSNDTEVDVRIIENDVTIQLIVRRVKMSNLLCVSRILDELRLDVLNVSGGCIGDYYSFWFNTKILEGSTVYASAIAKKLIEGVDKKPFGGEK